MLSLKTANIKSEVMVTTGHTIQNEQNLTVCLRKLCKGARNCPTKLSRQALRPTQPPNQWVLGYFPGAQQHRHEIDHLPPSSTAPKGTKLTGPMKLWCRNGLNQTTQTMMFMILTMRIFTLGEKIDSGSITSYIEVIR